MKTKSLNLFKRLNKDLVSLCDLLGYEYEFDHDGDSFSLLIYGKNNSFIGSSILENIPSLLHAYVNVNPAGALYLLVYGEACDIFNSVKS